MCTTRERSSTLQLLIGIVLAEAGAAIVGCGEWDFLKTGTPLLFYLVGFVVFVVGMFLVWRKPLSALVVEREADQVKVAGYCKLIGVIELNGSYLEAYEEESGDGKRFRLKSFPPLSSEREAGLIRYLIYEGIIEQRWPRLNGKIQEEAGWAFWT